MWPHAYQTAQCALYPAGERSSARGSGTGAVHADTWWDHMTLVPLGAAQLKNNNDKASKTLFPQLNLPECQTNSWHMFERLKVARLHAEEIWLLFFRSDFNARGRSSSFHSRDTFYMDRDQTDFFNSLA